MFALLKWNQMQYFSGPEQMGSANEGSPPCRKTGETVCVLYLSHLQPLILRITHSEQGCVRRKKKSALHHCTSLSMELLEDTEPFLCLDTVLFLLIEILSSEREQWCTPILLLLSTMWTNRPVP